MFTHTYTKQYLSLIKNTSSNKGDKYLLSGDACNFLPLEAPNINAKMFLNWLPNHSSPSTINHNWLSQSQITQK